jgi:signal peptidase II
MFQRLWALLLAAGIFALDRWSKWLVETRLGPYDTRVVLPGYFNIVRSENPGVAFGMLADGANHTRTLGLVAVSLAVLATLAVMLWKAERQDKATVFSLALIFGGAAGNVFDRVRSGMVTDFLDFHLGSYHWYVFNLADSAICVGTCLMILTMLLAGRKANPVSEPEPNVSQTH